MNILHFELIKFFEIEKSDSEGNNEVIKMNRSSESYLLV